MAKKSKNTGSAVEQTAGKEVKAGYYKEVANEMDKNGTTVLRVEALTDKNTNKVHFVGTQIYINQLHGCYSRLPFEGASLSKMFEFGMLKIITQSDFNNVLLQEHAWIVEQFKK